MDGKTPPPNDIDSVSEIDAHRRRSDNRKKIESHPTLAGALLSFRYPLKKISINFIRRCWRGIAIIKQSGHTMSIIPNSKSLCATIKGWFNVSSVAHSADVTVGRSIQMCGGWFAWSVGCRCVCVSVGRQPRARFAAAQCTHTWKADGQLKKNTIAALGTRFMPALAPREMQFRCVATSYY